MKENNTYTIPLKGLDAGFYAFEFKLDDAFFENIEGSEIKRGNVDVEAEVEKQSSMMIVRFYLEGEVEVACDRCLDMFYIPVETENTLSVRFSNIISGNQEYLVEENAEEDIIFADPKDEFLDVGHYLYESVCLSLPIQRVHPDDENGNTLCDSEVIKFLKQHNPINE